MARIKVYDKNIQQWVYADKVVAKDGTSITIESIEESTAASGSTKITFSDGNTIIVKNGTSAYQYALQAGFTGTEQEFAERLNTKGKITKDDLENSIQTSLDNADSALQPNDLADWVKTEKKPTYTADEVGALPDSTEIPSNLSDLSEDSTHRLVTDTEKQAWNAKSNFSGSYNDLTNKPTLGSMAAKDSVAKSDLASGVQTSLGKADSALQPSDISDWAKAAAKPTYTASEVGALPDSTKIPSKLGDLDNDKKYITAAEVPDEIYVGDGTMPNTATIQLIMDASDEEALLKDELQEYINTEIEAAKTKLELDIPSKTSQLTNDSGFITAEDIPEVQVPDLSGYAKTSDIPTKTSQLTNDSGFITQHQSLAGYAKTSDIPTKVSQLTNDSGFITAKDVPEAQVPDLSGYALKSSAETWTFTLSDGSTVTKKVVLA